MTTREMIIKMVELGILYADKEAIVNGKKTIYVEDSESYRGYAYIHFDENDNVIKIEGETCKY